MSESDPTGYTEHTRVLAIIDEISVINAQVKGMMKTLNEQPEFIEEIKQLVTRCTTLVNEATEIQRLRTGVRYTIADVDVTPGPPSGQGAPM